MFDTRAETIDFLDAAPLRLAHTATTRAPAKDVFEALSADVSTWGNWIDAVTRGEYGGEGPYGVGTRRRVILTGGVAFHETVIAWDDPTRYAYRIDRTTVPGIRAQVEEWTLVETSAGTRVRWTMGVDAALPLRLALRASAPGVGLAFKRAVSLLDRQLTARD